MNFSRSVSLSSILKLICATGFIGISLWAFLIYVQKQKAVEQPAADSPLLRLTSEAINLKAQGKNPGKFLLYDDASITSKERARIIGYQGNIDNVKDLDELSSLIKSKHFAFVVLPSSKLPDILSLPLFTNYVILPPALPERKEKNLLVHYGEEEIFSSATPIKYSFVFGEHNISDIYGFSWPRMLWGHGVRYVVGKRAALLFPSNFVMEEFSTRLSFRGLRTKRGLGKNVMLRLTVNGEIIGDLDFPKKEYSLQTYELPPGIWKGKSSVIQFEVIGADAENMKKTDRYFVLNKLWVTLLPPGRL